MAGADAAYADVFFMHIAKTGGSSLNSYFASHYPADAGIVHLEGQLFPVDAERTAGFRKKRLLSGHVRVWDTRQILEPLPHLRFTMLRRPFAQTLSHLHWVYRFRKWRHRKELKRMPPHIRTIVGRMREMGLVDYIRNISMQEELDLFDNLQTRYFIPERGLGPLDDAALERALEELHRFHAVGLNEHFASSLKLYAEKAGWPPPETLPPKENVSRYNKTCSPELTEAIHSITRLDARLYQEAESIFAKQVEAAGVG